MSILKELLALCEAEENKTFELSELFKNLSVDDAEKAVNKLWGSHKLTYKGSPFFTDSELGPAYVGAEEAAIEELKNDLEVTVTYESQSEDIRLDDLGSDDVQEVYLGWKKETNQLYIGFDFWLKDDGADDGPVWKAFEKMYKDEYDKDLDIDDDSSKWHAEWREYMDNNAFRGLLFELASRDGAEFSAELVFDRSKGFYRGIHGAPEFKRLNLIDIRLD